MPLKDLIAAIRRHWSGTLDQEDEETHAMTNAIETFDLTRRFGRTEAVKGLNLQVPAGSIFALLGPNGAGKTTTLKLLMNLVRATRGTRDGARRRHAASRPAQFQRIGYVSENQRLPEWMTPGELFDYCRPFYPAMGQRAAAKARVGPRARVTRAARARCRAAPA